MLWPTPALWPLSLLVHSGHVRARWAVVPSFQNTGSLSAFMPLLPNSHHGRWFQVELVLDIAISSLLISIISSVQFSCSVVSDSSWPHESQHARPPCPSPTPRVHSDSHPSSQWCHPAISSSVGPFSSCPWSNCQHPLDHRKSKRVPEKHLFLLYWLCQSLWLCGSQQTRKFFKRWEYQTTDLPLEKPVCRSGSTS